MDLTETQERQYYRIINRLVGARIVNKMTIDQVAQKLGVSKPLMHAWELGNRVPNLEKLIRWASLFDLEVTIVG